MPIKFFARQVSGDRQELGKLSDEVLQQGGDHCWWGRMAGRCEDVLITGFIIW